MSVHTTLRTILLSCLSLAIASAEHYSFDTNTDPWVTFGTSGHVKVAHEKANIHSGTGALQFDYTVAPGALSSAILPTPGSLKGITHVRFWIKSTSDAPIGVMMSEKKPGGGNYNAIIWCPKEKWQAVDLEPHDFFLGTSPSDPPDSDNKLDLDQVEGIAIVDLTPFLSALPDNPDVPMAIDRPRGARSLFVDDFELSSDPSNASSATQAVLIDNFKRAGLRWITLGGATLQLSSSNPFNAPALEADYEQNSTAFPVFVHHVGNPKLATARNLSLDIASAQDAELTISLEENAPSQQNGPRFNYTVSVHGGKKASKVVVPFADFQTDNAASSTKLDPAKLKSIALADITGITSNVTQANTLWITNVIATEK